MISASTNPIRGTHGGRVAAPPGCTAASWAPCPRAAANPPEIIDQCRTVGRKP